MNIRNNVLFLFVSLLMTFFLPHYTMAAFTFSALDTQGKLLNFGNPTLIAGTCPTGKTCTANGDGPAYIGAQYKYTNVITVGTTRVDAIISVDNIVNATLNTFDDATPNPIGSSRAGNGAYTTSFGVVVPEAAIFAPQITTTSHTTEGYVQFTIKFIDSTGSHVVLQNVYNNTLDIESVEYNAYGGFQSYRFASDNATNAKRVLATTGLNGTIRFSSSDCAGDAGLYIKDQSRVQTKFNTITSLTLINGQFNGTVPKIGGGTGTCSNSSIRYYGAIFAQDNFIDTPGTAIEYVAPTVNLLTTSNTKPSITGTLGGQSTTASPTGSPVGTGETFSIVLNGVTYTYPNANLVTSGANWTLNVPTALPIGTYDVAATRNGTLLDQTSNELVITPTCVLPQVLNTTATACITPGTGGTTTLCHSGEGKNYAKISIPASGLNGHETHSYDIAVDSNGLCPDDPVVCTLPTVRDAATNTCQTPPAACTSILGITSANSSISNIPASVSLTTTSSTSNWGNWWKKNSTLVMICDTNGTAANPYPYTLLKVKQSLVGNYANKNDYYPLMGSCPTQAMPCPGTSCDLPRMIDPSTKLCVIPPNPSVDTLVTSSITPVISGWVGGFTLGIGENLLIQVNGKQYFYNYTATTNSPELQVVNDQRWLLTINTSAPLSIGTTYDVVVDQNDTNTDGTDKYTIDSGDTTDTTTNEVTVVTAPTVVSQVTLNTTPTVTGTVGNLPLVSNEMFTVTINGITYSTSNATAPLTISGTTWTLTVVSALPTGMTYNVLATRNQYLSDATNSELVIPDAPTVVSQTTVNTTPIITGTAGSTGMVSTEPFSVVVNGKTYARGNANLTLTNIVTTTSIDDKGSTTGSLTNWSLQIPTSDILAAGTYNVTATRSTLVDTTSGELIIIGAPTVIPQTTANVTPTVTGTVGSSALSTGESFTVVVNGVTYTNGDGKLSVSGTAWTLNIIAALTPGTTYNVTATRAGTSVDPTSGELIIVSNPTVVTQSTSNTSPTITGTVGNAILSTIGNEAFSVMVNGVMYSKGNAALTISGMNWSLAIPTVLSVGTYNVDALRAGTLADTTSNELTIGGTQPTVTPLTTNNIKPTITGTFGTNALGASETFIVIVNGVTYTKGDGNLTIQSSSWSLTIPTGKELKVGTYDVSAIRNGTLHDLTTNELVIAIAVPTVIKQTVQEKSPIIIKGTIGDVALDTSETFTVLLNGTTYTSGDGKLVVSALNWILTIPSTTSIPANTYDVKATRDTTLVDTTTGELIVTALSPPTVVSQSTYKTTPTITGTIGTIALTTGESFTILVNGKTYTNGTSTNLVISGMNWTLTILAADAIAGSATPYNVVATRGGTLTDTTTGELTIQPCALPKVVNATGTACITPVPTVVSQTLNNHTAVAPVIVGTVGEVALGSTETFSVTIPTTSAQVYNKGDAALVISGINWTLTVPQSSAIPAGTYNIVAARNVSAQDATTGELIINLVCLSTETLVNGACMTTSSLPTVVSRSTADTAPTITGTVGGTALAAGEVFTVSVNGQTYSSGSALTITGTTWSLRIPLANSLNPGSYTVTATRNSTTGTGNLTITTCAAPNSIDTTTGACTLPSTVPTVNATTVDKGAASIVVTGTIGGSVLAASNDTFTVTVHNSAHSNLTGALIISGLNWSFTLSSPYFAGTFDVDAVRNTTADTTSGELIITDNISVCVNGVNSSIPRSSWDGARESTTYYLGSCSTPSNTLPTSPTTKSEVLPNEPTALINQYTANNGLTVYCSDGSVKGDSPANSPATGVTIKKATISNASVEGGTIDLLSSPTIVKYGIKTPAVGSMDISAATLIGNNKAMGVTLTGVTLDDVYLDTGIDYIDANGNANNSGTFINVMGGTTKPTTIKEDGSITHSLVTSGMITLGVDSTGSPVRGSITSGLFDTDVQNGDKVQTKGRRIRGKLINATITAAQTTSVSGVTVVDAGTVTAGTMQTGSTSPISTFGTVYNATLTGISISSANHCSSSSTGGAKGQLNWKEIIKQ